MNTYQIRFNKTRGQEGRGTSDHAWRVFENGKEFLFKNLDIAVPVKSEQDANGVDYNITCQGYMVINRDTSTAVITKKVKKQSHPVKPNAPEIKIICISNVYSRLMHFKNKGDVEDGHKHTFHHGSLVSSGSVLYEVLGEDGQAVSSKVFKAPNFIFVDKDKKHKITALENNTVCACIHALKTIDQELLDPDFLIEPLVGDFKGIISKTILNKTGKRDFPLLNV
jgi:hypothetical protein